MITGEIKNRIDQIWDTFWTGGITNSITILEQMTYLFFMKMLDDAQIKKEASAALLGTTIADPTFKEGMWHNPETDRDVPYENLRWHIFKNTDADTMFNTVRNDVFPFIKNLNSGKASAYSRYMANAVFLIQSPNKLTKIVDGVDALDMNNRDAMGDVYEYVLGKMAASGNNGQFRTPRHIIRMIVELMKPTQKDEICDPAMGSAGFIVESAKYITEHYKSELLKKENADHYRHGMFHGFDTDATMLRIGAMNLMLHGADEPDVEYRDSLSDDNADTDKYTLCLANPPFAGSVDKETISKSLLAIASTTKTELLFVSLFVRMLQLGGRCASIVPDGVLFGNSNAHQSVRKELVDNQRLQAVISMPSGVFQPYSGVSTAILIFTKTNAGGTDKVWFYDMQADGYTLDQKRTECAENDIPDVIARFNNLTAEEDRTRKDKSFFVPVEEIRQNDYVLSINKYKEVEREVVEYEKPDIVLGRIEALESEIIVEIGQLRKMLVKDTEYVQEGDEMYSIMYSLRDEFKYVDPSSFSGNGISFLVCKYKEARLSFEVRMEPHGKEGPHIHISIGKNEHAASYSIQNGTRNVGEVPSDYDKVIQKWILAHQKELLDKWDRSMKGQLPKSEYCIQGSK